MEAIEQYMETRAYIWLETVKLNEILEKHMDENIDWCHVGDMVNALQSLKQLNDQLSGEQDV